MRSHTAFTLAAALWLAASAARAAVPREGTWELQSFDPDVAVDVHVQGNDLVMHRAMHKEYEGAAYTLEHLFRGKLGEGKLSFQMLARDDPKAAFEDLRAVEVVVVSPEEMMLDGARLLFREGPQAAAPAPAPVQEEPATAWAPAPATATAMATAMAVPSRWSAGVGYLSQIVRHPATGKELAGLFRSIAVTREGAAALSAADEAFGRKEFKQAAASYEAALAAGVPVSRLVPRLAQAYLEVKDCARAEKMVARAQRLDPEGKAPAEMAVSLKKTCPAARVASAPARLDRAAAARIVEALQAQDGTPHRLASPRSYDDVAEVLKLDQLNLFPAAVAFIGTQKDTRAQALSAQIELAWAEALQQLAEIDLNLAARFRELAERAEQRAAAGGQSAEQFKHLSALRAHASDAQQTSEALRLAASDHLARGMEVARKVIAQAPADYLGYRVAADYHRLLGDWKSFDVMMAKLEKTNPASNGLVFLKGVAAYQRGRDVAGAMKLLRAAVANDPRFARAQAHLVMIQPTLEETWVEFGKLKEMSPEHPIVRWTGPVLERFHAEAGK